MKQEICNYITNYYSEIRPEPKHAELTRNQLFNLVAQGDLYSAAESIFKWGGIRSNNKKKFHAMEKDVVEQRLDSVHKLINDENGIDNAFNSMYNGENKLDGIGVSFLTKILYFFDNSKTGQKALIFDKWSQLWHYAMLDDGKRNEWYSPKLFSNGKVNGGCLIGNPLEAYKDYMSCMREYACACEIENYGKLEGFLFGKKRKRNQNSNDNPRIWLIDFLNGLQTVNSTSNTPPINNSNFGWEELNNSLKWRKLGDETRVNSYKADKLVSGYGLEIVNKSNERERFWFYVGKQYPNNWFHCLLRQKGSASIYECQWSLAIVDRMKEKVQGKSGVKTKKDNKCFYLKYGKNDASRENAIQHFNEIVHYLEVNNSL